MKCLVHLLLEIGALVPGSRLIQQIAQVCVGNGTELFGQRYLTDVLGADDLFESARHSGRVQFRVVSVELAGLG